MPPSTFDARLFQASLQTNEIGRYFTWRHSTESTMSIARREAEEGAAHGALILAEEQTAGRGRRGRSFFSPPAENLYFTLILRCEPALHRRLPVIIPVAVCEAIRNESADARIKWPNDIWIGQRKLAGMLIDAEIGAEGPVAFPGIGINVNGDPTVVHELRDTATSLRREVGRPVQRETLLASVCNRVEAMLLPSEDPLIVEYRSLSMILDEQVTVSPAGGEPYSRPRDFDCRRRRPRRPARKWPDRDRRRCRREYSPVTFLSWPSLTRLPNSERR